MQQGRAGYGNGHGQGYGPGSGQDVAYGQSYPQGYGPDDFYDERVLTLRDYFTVLRRHRWIVIITVLVTVLGTLAYSLTRTPLYQASSLITVTPVVGIETTLQQISGGPVATQAQIDVLSSTPTRERVERLIGPIGAGVSFTSRDSTSIRITAVSPDPRRAALVANTYAEVFSDVRREDDLERNARAAVVVRERFDEVSADLRALGVNPLTGVGPENARTSELLSLLRSYSQQLRSLEDQAAFIAQGRVALIDPAAVPLAPFTPQPQRDAVLALLFGALLGVGLALLRDYLRDTIQDDLDVRRASGMRPLIGRIPTWQLPSGVTKGAITLIDATSIAAEAYRELSTNVRFLVLNERVPADGRRAAPSDGELRPPLGASVMLVSAGADNGKTATAVNLAVTAARAGQRVVLVDADLRRTAVAGFFGLGRMKGLSDAIVDQTDASSALIAVGVDNLRVLPAGTIPPNPTDLLAGRGMDRIHHQLTQNADLVIYDTPAALAVPDVLEVGRLVDGAVLVLRHRISTRREVSVTIERLETLGVAIIGTVLNGIDTRSDAYYHYYSYYYGSGYASTAESAPSLGRRGQRRARRAAREGERVRAGSNGHGAPPQRSTAGAPRYGADPVGRRFIPDRPVDPPRE
jgi:succinoglycan biosynthesis transport protein ExoP